MEPITNQGSEHDGKLQLHTLKGEIVFIEPANVLFAKSSDHWVLVLVKEGNQFAWHHAHNTLHDFLLFKAAAHLTRCGRFYGINRARVTKHSVKPCKLVFDNTYTVELEHPLRPYFL